MAFVDREGAKLWWGTEGSGEPLLLIAGLGVNADGWYRLLPLLSAHFRTIRLDNRGVGRSDVPPGPYSIETMADDALAVLDAAGEGMAHIFGQSMGGTIAQDIALRAPHRVSSLILGCTSVGGSHTIRDPEVAQLMQSQAGLTPREFAEAAIPFAYSASTPRVRIDEDIEVRLRFPTSPEGYRNQLNGVRGYPGTYDRLGQLNVPTLIITGNDDRLAPPANSTVLENGIAGARLVVLKDAGHWFVTEQPEGTAEALIEFVGAVKERVGQPSPARG